MRDKPKLTPRKVPRQARSRATVDAILIATGRILVNEGYEQATTNRIAEVAGVSIGSLYQYFPTLDSLVFALYEQSRRQELDQLTRRMMLLADHPLPEVIRELIMVTVSIHKQHLPLLSELARLAPAIGADRRAVEVEREMEQMMAEFLLSRPREVRNLDVERAAMIATRAVAGVSNHMLRFSPEELVSDADKLVDELSDLVTRYLVADG